MSVYRQHPPGGPPSTSSTSVVAAVGLPTASPRGPAINVFNFGGGCCRSTNSTPRGPANDVFISSGGCCWPSASTPQGAHHRHLQLQWRPLPVYRHNPPGGPPSVSSTSVVATVGLPIATPRGPAIDVFNFGGDRCRSTNSTPRGGHHRCLLISDGGYCQPSARTPRGSAIDVFNFDGGCYRSTDSTPTGSAINVFIFGGGCCRPFGQHPSGGPPSTSSTSVVVAVGLPTAPPGGPPSMSSTSVAAATGLPTAPLGVPASTSSTSVVATAGLPTVPSRGPTIDVFNFCGGHCQSTDITLEGPRHRRLQLRWWSLPVYRRHLRGGPPSISSSSPVLAAVGLQPAPPEGQPSTFR
jgi:hypothetical protein